ncbi:hypothetical protein [Nitrosomonas oligotropha]|uniref:hypothetical protein n=1 Tax=Nitrosomonas oligotropha TaxID=42354 RepID=UPI0015E7A817|nr:hypothetical protein [Nitrosomonas oligotropha]
MYSQSDFFQDPQNDLSRRSNIQSHKTAALSSGLRDGIQADTGLVDEEGQSW